MEEEDLQLQPTRDGKPIDLVEEERWKFANFVVAVFHVIKNDWWRWWRWLKK